MPLHPGQEQTCNVRLRERAGAGERRREGAADRWSVTAARSARMNGGQGGGHDRALAYRQPTTKPQVIPAVCGASTRVYKPSSSASQLSLSGNGLMVSMAWKSRPRIASPSLAYSPSDVSRSRSTEIAGPSLSVIRTIQ